MIHNGIELQVMTYNGQEVNSWIHNGVEVYSGKVQLKYVMYFYKVSANNYNVNVKKYSMKDDTLIDERTVIGNAATGNIESYNDGIIRLHMTISNPAVRWWFTPLVEGESTADTVVNRGSDYGGTAEQIVPYLENSNCTVTFITTDKYKPT